MIETILDAFAIVTGIPGVMDAVRKIGVSIYSLRAAQALEAKERAVTSALDIFVEGQRHQLDDLMKGYHAFDDDEDFDAIEKHKYQRRIAAQACRLLKTCEGIKDRIPQYDDLVKTFCEIAPRALET